MPKDVRPHFSHTTLILLAYIGFISLGLPDAVHGIAWPKIRPDFELSQIGLGLILAFGSGGYLLSSFFTGKILQRMHVGTLLALSTTLVALGLLGYSLTTYWFLFLICSFLIGSGSGAIDGGLNSYISKKFSASHMSWLHGCYGIGASLGPFIMTQALIKGDWRQGYFFLGTIMVALAITFAITRSVWENSQSASEEKTSLQKPATFLEAIKNKHVLLQTVMFFFYTGLEVSVAQWSFSLNTSKYGMSIELAGMISVLFWISLTVGRFLMGFLVAKFGTDHLLRFAFIGTCLGALLLNIPMVPVSIIAHATLGFCLSAIYPLLMSATLQRVGSRLVDHSIGMQVSAGTLGVMILPTLAGWMAQGIGLAAIPLVVAIAAAALLFFHFLTQSILKTTTD